MISLPPRPLIIAEKSRRSFYYFLQAFWHIIVKEDYVDNWHVQYLCDELQGVGELILDRQPKPYDLLINIPPGSSKSTIVTVMFPVWLWIKDPTIKAITGSYSLKLSTEHALLSRDLIRSSEFREAFPYLQIKDDRDNKQDYGTNLGGARIVTSVGSGITGEHAHIIIIDDPLNPREAGSELARGAANKWISQTLPTRKIDKKNTPTIMIMQRLHEDDCSGYWLKNKADLKHICLPGEVSNDVKPDELKERYTNGLFDIRRLDRSVLDSLKSDLGSYGYSGQIMQRPAPEEGGLIKKHYFPRFSMNDELKGLPRNFYSDTAYGKEGSDYSATACYSVLGGTIYLWKMWTVRLTFPDFIRSYISFLKSNQHTMQSRCYFEPKASGISIVQQLRNESIDGSRINLIEDEPPKDSKITRTMAILPMIESGGIKLLDSENWDSLLTECAMFPNGEHDDQVDVISAICRLSQENQSFKFVSNY